jgi:Ca-activated chloride channel family protein
MPRFAAIFFALVALALGGCHAPPPADPHALTAEGSLSNRYVRTDAQTSLSARLVIAAQATETTGRPPVNLALVVDTSGSMEGRAIEDARAASKALLSALRTGDRIAVVAFGSTTELILPSTPIEDANVAKLRARIDAMKAFGTTDMAGGLEAGMAQVQSHFVADGVNRVILLGDGDPNDAAPVKRAAMQGGNSNISITALGLGPDYNETLMGEVAALSGGRFHYVDDSSKVAAFFDAEVVRLNRVYAKNAVVELVAGPGVSMAKVVGQAGGGHRRLSIPIGDLSFGETREIIVRLDAPAHRDGAAVELLDAVLRFEDVRAGVPVERRVFFGAHASASADTLKQGRNEGVERAVAKAEAAAATLEAIEAARRGAVDKAREKLKGAQGYQFDDDKLMQGDLSNALPSLAPSAAPSPPSSRAGSVVKKAHDRAMEILYTH